MEFIDNCASISYSRYAHAEGVTASMDTLNFLAPLPERHSVTVMTFVTGSGERSVEVFAKIIGENLKTGERYLAATAFLTFVNTNENYETHIVLPETSEESYIAQGYPERRKERLKKSKENAAFNQNVVID